MTVRVYFELGSQSCNEYHSYDDNIMEASLARPTNFKMNAVYLSRVNQTAT